MATNIKPLTNPVKPSKPIAFRPICEIVAEQREPAWLIDDILERDVIAVLAGPRGTFKSFIALDWAMRMALDDHAGIIMSGEGAGLDRRIAAWMHQHRESVDLSTVPIMAMERPLNLRGANERNALCEAIEKLARPPTFAVIDTLSKFAPGIKENDNGEMADFLDGLHEDLREPFHCTVLLVAHSGHGNAARPRGASSLMAIPTQNTSFLRPDLGMKVTVSRERFKDTPALPPLAYEAKVIDLGRLDRRGRPVTSLALVTTDAPPISKGKGWGKNQEKVIVALKEWKRQNPGATPITSIDMREICKAQHIDRKREREVLNAFVNARILTPSIGGYALHGENL